MCVDLFYENKKIKNVSKIEKLNTIICLHNFYISNHGPGYRNNVHFQIQRDLLNMIEKKNVVGIVFPGQKPFQPELFGGGLHFRTLGYEIRNSPVVCHAFFFIITNSGKLSESCMVLIFGVCLL